MTIYPVPLQHSRIPFLVHIQNIQTSKLQVHSIQVPPRILAKAVTSGGHSENLEIFVHPPFWVREISLSLCIYVHTCIYAYLDMRKYLYKYMYEYMYVCKYT